MKNERIVDAWDKIEPDGMAEEHMLRGILAHKHASETENGKFLRVDTAFGRRVLIPLAVCLVLIVVLTAVIGGNTNRLEGRVHTVDVGTGATMDFYRTDAPGIAGLDFGVDVTSRDLTADENRILLGDSTATSYGIFSTEDASLLHVEGYIGATRFVFAAPGVPVSDTVIDAAQNASEVDGVPVFAGYFITAENSKGMRNIIYFAEFTLGDVSVYVERGGPEAESEALREEIASVIGHIIQNGTPDLARILA